MDVPQPPFNPYTSPAAGPIPSYSPPGAAAVGAQTIAELVGTRPWVRLLAVASWVLVALIVLGSVVMVIVTLFGLSGAKGPGAVGAALGATLVYLLFSLLMAYPALRLSGYAKSIQSLETSRSVRDLDAALSEQRRLWKFYGIVTVVYLVVAVIGIGAAVLIPLLLR